MLLLSARPACLKLRDLNAPLPVSNLLLQLPNLVLDANVVDGLRLVPAGVARAMVNAS